MKTSIYSILLVALGTLTISCKNDNAVSKIKKENILAAEKRDASIKEAPVITFDKTVFDFGTVNEGDVVKTSFVLTNTGKSDLIILDAKATCGCTVPTWPKEAVKPGKTAEVTVEFNTKGKPNQQTKTITLATNTEKGNERVTLKGMVLPKKK